jgi:FkbM family methyltransferase
MKPYNRIGLAQYAVGNYTGVARMQPHISNMGAGEINDGGNTEVSIIALDRIHLTDVTLMKIDVEWHEPQVIEGAQDTLFRCHPLILIEDANKEYAPLLPQYELIQSLGPS